MAGVGRYHVAGLGDAIGHEEGHHAECPDTQADEQAKSLFGFLLVLSGLFGAARVDQISDRLQAAVHLRGQKRHVGRGAFCPGDGLDRHIGHTDGAREQGRVEQLAREVGQHDAGAVHEHFRRHVVALAGPKVDGTTDLITDRG